MRLARFIIAGLLVTGCQSMQSKPTTQPVAQLTEKTYRENPASSALVFSAPIAAQDPELDLARNGRSPSAYLGYEEAVVSNYYLRVDDRQDDYWGDRYQRRSVVSQSVTRFR